jgi:hypothetical protein
VRIGVRETGLYRVSRADLQANGFDVNASAERWQLYVNGVEQAINVGAGGDYVEFYGKAIDTINSVTQIYFLVVVAQNGKLIGSTLRRRLGGSVTSQNYSQSFFKKERLFYKQDILNGDAENIFGTTYNNTFPGTVNFNLNGVAFSSVNSSLDITLQGITLVAHQSKIILNGVELGVVTGSNYNPMNGHFDFPTSVLREGANTLVLTSFGQGDINAFDRMKINFNRLYRAEQNRLSFFVPNYKAS